VQGLADAADLLAQRAARPLQRMELNPIAVAQEPPQCAAVDGSSAVLVDNGTVWVVAVRAVAVHRPGPPMVEPTPAIVAALPHEAQAAVEARHAARALPVPRVRTAEAFADAAMAAAKTLQRGDLLLLDGALHGLPPGPAAAAGQLAEACAARGVRLAAVAKRSGLERGGVPMVASVLAQANTSGQAGPWSVEVEPGVHVAKLHRAARHAFRIDGDADLLPALAAMANDAVYVGYPYALAAAHNLVALTEAHVRELRAGLDLELRRRGHAAAGLADDFHAVLDANVPG
jgi:hypothetical protein